MNDNIDLIRKSWFKIENFLNIGSTKITASCLMYRHLRWGFRYRTWAGWISLVAKVPRYIAKGLKTAGVISHQAAMGNKDLGGKACYTLQGFLCSKAHR